MLRVIGLSFLFVSLVAATYTGNYALSFDGIDDIVTVPHSYQDLLLTDFWTVEAWINPTAEQSFWQLNLVGYPQRHPNVNYCGKNNGQCVPGEPLAQLRDAKGAWFPVIGTASKVSPNSWHHLAATWNNNSLSLYLDGVLDVQSFPYQNGYTEALSCATNGQWSCDAGLQIGGNFFRMEAGLFSNQYFRGYIDEVRVWTFARGVTEIQNTMGKSLIGNEPGLLYYFRFDDYGRQVTRSSAFDVYALLGEGRKDAEPKFIMSDAPLSAPPSETGGRTPTPAPAPVTHGGGAGAVTAGALIGVFCLLGGFAIGGFIGWKSYSKFRGGFGGENKPLL